MIKVHFKFSGMDTFAIESESLSFGGVLDELIELKPDLNLGNYDFFSVEKGDNIDRSASILSEQHVHAYPKVAKIKNGMDRKSLYNWIKENDLASKFKEDFNKSYTNSSTTELEKFYYSQNNSNETEGEHEAKCCCEPLDMNPNDPIQGLTIRLDSIERLIKDNLIVTLNNLVAEVVKKENQTKAKIVPSDWSPVD
ncbi:MAG: hypothetical protein J6N78_02050 [Clostridia bacterium]|nr:hypothetical protein [Clostridia bacterium]